MINTCSPASYLPSNVSTSTQEIKLILSSSSQQDRSLFGQQSKSDIKIFINNHTINAHKIVLQKSMSKLANIIGLFNSGYYEMRLPSQIKIKVLNEILPCVYGYNSSIRRYQVMEIYGICEYFGISEILQNLNDDMIDNFDQYQIFPLLKLATRFKIKNVKNYCYQQLHIQQFQPIKYNKSGLFICQEELFRQIINQHNCFKSQSRNKYGLTQEEIQQLVNQYCQINDYSKQRKKQFVIQIKKEKCSKNFLTVYSQIDRQILTPIKQRANSEVILRNTLSLPNVKYESSNQVKQFTIMNDKTLSSSRSSLSCLQDENSGNQQSESEKQENIQNYKIQYSEIFKSNSPKEQFLPQTINRNSSSSNRSRKGSIGSSDTGFMDPKILKIIQSITLNESNVAKDNQKMIQRIAALNKKAQGQFKQGKYRKAKLQNIQNLLQQIEMDIKKDNAKVKQLQKSVYGLQTIHQSRRLNDQFQKSKIGLNLTQSTHFGEFYQKMNLRM